MPVFAFHPTALAQFVTDDLDFFGFARQKFPICAQLHRIGIALEFSWSIVFWIDGDGIKMNILARDIFKLIVELGHACHRERANRAARGEDKIDDNFFAFDEVVVEAKRPTVLIDNGQIGQIRSAPAGLLVCG